MKHEYITENDYNIPSTLPLMNNKVKSMKAPNIPQSFHIPSQQSIDMNPYIGAQFIGFEPQFMFIIGIAPDEMVLDNGWVHRNHTSISVEQVFIHLKNMNDNKIWL